MTQPSADQNIGGRWARAVAPLAKSGRWLRAYAALHAVMGGLMAVTVVGLLMAWAFFWMAWLMYQASLAADRIGPSGDPEAVAEVLDRVSLQFVVQLGVVVAAALLWVGVGLMGGLRLPGIG